MKKIEVRTEIPKIKGGRCISVEVKEGYILTIFEVLEEGEDFSISQSELECRIDPTAFDGEWLQHKPTTYRQKQILQLYENAKSKDKLHAFTCMTIDPTLINGKLVYMKGMKPVIKLSQREWAILLKEYCPSRNSRQMTVTEYACKNLFLIEKLVNSGYEIDRAWQVVCDDSKEIGNYCDSKDAKRQLEVAGSREVCGFYDLANDWKLLAEDSWDETDGFWRAGGGYSNLGYDCPICDLYHHSYKDKDYVHGIGMIVLDT